MRRSIGSIVPAVALAAALAACGGGTSKADFVAKADAACAPGNASVGEVTKPANLAQVATAAGTLQTTVDAQVSRLRGLDLPGGDDKRSAEGAIAALADVGSSARAMQEAAGKNDDVATATATAETKAKIDNAATQAGVAGMSQCGRGLQGAFGNISEGTRSTLKTAYVAKGEALCRDTARKADALTAPGASGASLSRFIDSLLPLMTKLAADIKALPVVPGDEAIITELTAALDNSLPKLKDFGAAAKANNTRLAASLSEELDVLSTAANAKLDSYGLRACGTLGEV